MKKISALLASISILLAAVALSGPAMWAGNKPSGGGNQGGSGSSVPAQMTINDAWSGTLLASDYPVSGSNTYVDHSLSGGSPCVTAWVSSNGLFFIYLDYNPTVGSPGTCDSTLGFVDGTSEDRTYSVTFPGSDVCSALGFSSSPCTLVVDGSPRIRADNLFSSGASTTPVEFMFYLNGNSYSLKTDSGADITGTGSSRTATYEGNATLWQDFTAPQKPKQIGSSFAFPFQITVEE